MPCRSRETWEDQQDRRLAGQHAQERSQREALAGEVDALKATVATEGAAHKHAVQQYVAELEARSRVQAELADERAAKEHAMHVQSVTEARNMQLLVRFLANIAKTDQ